MKLSNDFSITRLFIDKYVNISVDELQSFSILIPSLRDFYTNHALNSIYHLWVAPISKIQKIYVVPVKDSFDGLTTMIFDLGRYDKYRVLANNMRDTLVKILPQAQIDMSSHQIKIDSVTMTLEIWEYILYILQLSCGEKTVQPPVFSSEETRQAYMAQKQNEDKIAQLRRQGQQDKEILGKMMLSITYAFPSLTFDYLINQTMAQIQWLQKYAAGAMSYEVNAQAMAAGNMKKGKKLDFFIK